MIVVPDLPTIPAATPQVRKVPTMPTRAERNIQKDMKDVDMAMIIGSRTAPATSDGAAARRKPDIAEVYSPPRVTASAAKYNLQPGWSLDLTTVDKNGVPWDFSKGSRRRDGRDRLEATRPKVLIGSPMCKAFSALHALSAGKRDPNVVRRQLVEAEVHSRFCCELYELQIRRGDYFVHEHPAGATSWRCECVRRILAIP